MAKIKHAALIEEFEDTKWYALFWPLCSLSFDLQLQIIHLVSSNSSINVACFILAIVLSVLNTMVKIKNDRLIEEFEDTKGVI
jgi:hypothetical protein